MGIVPSLGLVYSHRWDLATLGLVAILEPMSPLRIGDLLAKRGLTAYQLAAQSDGRISKSTAYRLTNNEVERVSSATVAALCEVLRCKPGDLFAEE